MLIDTKSLSEQRAWKVSKVNRISPNGIVRVTLAQDTFDKNHDLIETMTDELGRTRVIGMWADGQPYGIQAPDLREEFPSVGVYAQISCSGLKPAIKVGGSYKTLTVDFMKDDEKVAFQKGDWSFNVDNQSVDDLIVLKRTDDENKIKIKFTGNDDYIGKILTTSYKSVEGVKTSFDLHIESV